MRAGVAGVETPPGVTGVDPPPLMSVEKGRAVGGGVWVWTLGGAVEAQNLGGAEGEEGVKMEPHRGEGASRLHPVLLPLLLHS